HRSRSPAHQGADISAQNRLSRSGDGLNRHPEHQPRAIVSRLFTISIRVKIVFIRDLLSVTDSGASMDNETTSTPTGSAPVTPKPIGGAALPPFGRGLAALSRKEKHGL